MINSIIFLQLEPENPPAPPWPPAAPLPSPFPWLCLAPAAARAATAAAPAAVTATTAAAGAAWQITTAAGQTMSRQGSQLQNIQNRD